MSFLTLLGWRNDTQYPQYPNQGLHPTPPPVPPQSREEWEHRNSRPTPDQNSTQWSGMHQRYPPPAVPTGPPAGVQNTPQHPGYYYQNNNSASPIVGVQGSPPNANQRMRMPMIRDNKQQPYPPGPQHKMPVSFPALLDFLNKNLLSLCNTQVTKLEQNVKDLCCHFRMNDMELTS